MKKVFKILNMPETMILYRFFFEWLGEYKKYPISQQAWWKCWQETFENLNEQETAELKEIIHKNKFASISLKNYNSKFSDLLNFYTNFRDSVSNPETELYVLKQEYDKNPTRKIRHKKIK